MASGDADPDDSSVTLEQSEQSLSKLCNSKFAVMHLVRISQPCCGMFQTNHGSLIIGLITNNVLSSYLAS